MKENDHEHRKTSALTLTCLLLLSLTAPIACVAKAQPLDPADFQVESFPVGNNPQFLAFDGANIWGTNKDDAKITKLRALAFDGNKVWVTQELGHSRPRPEWPGAIHRACRK